MFVEITSLRLIIAYEILSSLELDIVFG